MNSIVTFVFLLQLLFLLSNFLLVEIFYLCSSFNDLFTYLFAQHTSSARCRHKTWRCQNGDVEFGDVLHKNLIERENKHEDGHRLDETHVRRCRSLWIMLLYVANRQNRNRWIVRRLDVGLIELCDVRGHVDRWAHLTKFVFIVISLTSRFWCSDEWWLWSRIFLVILVWLEFEPGTVTRI